MLTGWKRRSKAESFSMCLRYSSAVVAPMTWISPRESGGFRMEAASMEPSAEPAPMTVWISSMKRMSSSEPSSSWTTFFMRSSNSPRYLEPATREAKSRVQTCLPRRMSGTLPEAMSWASPSTMAVLPTPGSPRMSGLFFWRRARTCMTRSISRSRPMTGSSLPSAATLVRLRPYCSSMEASSEGAGWDWPPPTPMKTGPEGWPWGACWSGWFAVSSLTALRTASPETPMARRASMARPLPSATMPSSRCSVAM